MTFDRVRGIRGGGGGGGGGGQNICYYVAVFVIPFNLIGNIDHILKKLTFDLLTRVRGMGGCLQAK